MLDTFRKASQTWFVKVLFAVLVLSFTFWGIGPMGRELSLRNAAITVGDKEIGAQEVADRFRRDVDRMAQAFGTKLTVEQARQIGLLRQTVDRLVDAALLDQAAGKLGLGVDEATLRKTIAGIPAFQSQLKMFDKTTYFRVLAANNMTEKRFIADERSDLAREQLIKAVAGGVTAPNGLAAPLYTRQRERRVAEYVVFAADKMPAPAAPEEAVLKKYYEDHKPQFQQPELRSATVLAVHAADLAASVHPTDAEIEQAYQARLGEFQTQEKRSVSQVLFNDQAEAQAFFDSVKGGKNFAAAAKEAGKLSSDLGAVTKAEMPIAELADAAFGTPGPGPVGPVQSTLGWHVLDIGAVTPGATKPLAEVKEQIVKGLVKDEATNRLYGLSTKLEDGIGAGNDIDTTAKSLGMSAVRLDGIDQRGRDADGKPVASPVATPEIVDSIFQTVQGGTSDVVAFPNNDGYFVLHVDKVAASALKPFEAVRSQIETAWGTEAKSAEAKRQAEAAAERIKKGEALSAIAGPLKVETSRPFLRDGGNNRQVPPLLAAEIFRLKEVGGIAVVPVGADSMVARLKEIQTADPSGPAYEGARKEMGQILADDLMQEYAAYLKKEIGARVNMALIDQQFGK